jgi:integrase
MGQLTDRTVKSAPVGKHEDGDGLRLIVKKGRRGTLRRNWFFRYQVGGERHDMALGSYPVISLSEARLAVGDARKLMAAGIDPIESRRAKLKAEKPIPTFGDIATVVIADAQRKSSNAKVRYQWERHLGEAYSAPLLKRPVNEITALEVAAVLRPIWNEKPEVARKLYPAIRRVFEHARIRLRDDHSIVMPENPARWADLKALGFEAPRQLSRGSHPSLPHVQIPEFMADLRARSAVAARALEFLILSNARTDAVLKAKWREFDLEQAVWMVPLASLKDRKHRKESFRVPLSPRAVDIIREMRELKASDFVFPGYADGKPLSNMALLTLLKRMNNVSDAKWVDSDSKRPITAHGFRATFRTWAEETTSFPHAVVEEAMGHQVGTRVERAYRRTDVIDKRRELMVAWAFYAEKRTNVISLEKARA